MNEEEAVEFIEALQGCVRQVPEQDMLIIIRDFIARVGNDVAGWHGTLDRFRPAEQNKNGLKLLDFCVLNSLVVTNTFFQHRPCHQHTWFHPVESSPEKKDDAG